MLGHIIRGVDAMSSPFRNESYGYLMQVRLMNGVFNKCLAIIAPIFQLLNSEKTGQYHSTSFLSTYNTRRCRQPEQARALTPTLRAHSNEGGGDAGYSATRGPDTMSCWSLRGKERGALLLQGGKITRNTTRRRLGTRPFFLRGKEGSAGGHG